MSQRITIKYATFMAFLKHTDKQFLSLLKAGLWGISPDLSLFQGAIDWERIIKQARRQTVSPIVFDGLEYLPQELRPEQAVKFQWYVDVMHAERQNALFDKTLLRLVEQFESIGLSPIVIKGQSLSPYYKKSSHRVSGDIDLYFTEGYEKANALAKTWTPDISQEDLDEQSWKHQLGYVLLNGVAVENHKESAFFFSKQRTRIWKDVEKKTGLYDLHYTFNIGEKTFRTLPPTLNAIFVFQHLLRHLLFFGVGFRQVCDWVLLLQNEMSRIDIPVFLESIDRLELRRGMTALALIAEQYLGIEKGLFPFDTTTSQAQNDAEVMLSDILLMGNFGHDTEIARGKDSLQFAPKLHAYQLLITRFFTLSRFGSREIMAGLRMMSMKYTKKSYLFLRNKIGHF